MNKLRGLFKKCELCFRITGDVQSYEVHSKSTKAPVDYSHKFILCSRCKEWKEAFMNTAAPSLYYLKEATQ